MTATQTSVEAFRSLGPSLGREQLRVLRLLKEHGPGTAKEIAKAAGEPITLQKRLPELVEMGLAERLCERPCFVTRKTATVWKAKESFGPPPPVSGKSRGVGQAGGVVSPDSLNEPAKAVTARPVAVAPQVPPPSATTGLLSVAPHVFCKCGKVAKRCDKCGGVECKAQGHAAHSCQPNEAKQ